MTWSWSALMKKSEWRTDGAVFTQVIESVGEDGRSYRQKLQVGAHRRHYSWMDCPTCLGKHRKERRARNRREKAARRVSRG